MEKFASIVASSRGFPLPLSRWVTVSLIAAFAIFLLCGTWYSRDTISLEVYKHTHLNAPTTLDAHTEVKELLVDHSPVPQPNLDTTSGNEPWNDCLHLPGAENILLILKTGATAIYERLPIHFESTFKCVPNYIIISDLEQTIGSVQTHDVLQLVSQPTRETHSDFDLYYDIADYHATGQDPSKLPGSAAWNLDKWKFLPMIHKAWSVSQTEYNNTIDWFVMMEADTSISWLNLIHYLQTKDPSIPQYIGSPAMLVVDGSSFAHGGSGVIMSRTAIEKVENKRKTFQTAAGGSEQTSMAAYDRYWEKHTEDICCGDAVLAHAFTDVGIAVASARPMIQGDTVLSIPWEPSDHSNPESQLWCKTPITWHHVKGGEIDELWQFQKKWVQQQDHVGSWNTTYLFKDIFEEFIAPHIEHGRSTKTDWDNLSDWFRIEVASEGEGGGITVSGPEITLPNPQDQEELNAITSVATESAQNCEVACERRGWPHPWTAADDCLQWKWAAGKCYLDYKIRLGEVMDQDTIKEKSLTWTSGWMKERVLGWKVKQGDCGRPQTAKESVRI